MKAADIVVTTPHMKLPGDPPWNFHRLIIDESHLFDDRSASWGGKFDHVKTKLLAPTMWLVTPPLSRDMADVLSAAAAGPR